MPELPEVETLRRGLGRLLPGHTFKSVTSDHPKSFPNAPQEVAAALIGATVTAVERRAKVLLIELSSKYSLVIHLKMTGQLVFVGGPPKQNEEREIENKEKRLSDTHAPFDVLRSAEPQVRFGAGHPSGSLVGELPDKSTRVTCTFVDGSKLFFNDQRKFGWMRLLPTAEVPQIDFFRKVGPEPLAADFTWRDLRQRLQRRQNTTIKAALLDQAVLAGVGNIYADESLWGARIHPATLVRELSARQIHGLYDSLQAVLRLSIEKGGSTDRTYVDAEGRRGSYLSFANVFRREGRPCPRHPGVMITKIRVAGRGTHICPVCQKVRD